MELLLRCLLACYGGFFAPYWNLQVRAYSTCRTLAAQHRQTKTGLTYGAALNSGARCEASDNLNPQSESDCEQTRNSAIAFGESFLELCVIPVHAWKRKKLRERGIEETELLVLCVFPVRGSRLEIGALQEISFAFFGFNFSSCFLVQSRKSPGNASVSANVAQPCK